MFNDGARVQFDITFEADEWGPLSHYVGIGTIHHKGLYYDIRDYEYSVNEGYAADDWDGIVLATESEIKHV